MSAGKLDVIRRRMDAGVISGFGDATGAASIPGASGARDAIRERFGSPAARLEHPSTRARVGKRSHPAPDEKRVGNCLKTGTGALAAVIAVAALAASPAAASGATCFGKAATQVGSNGGTTMVAKPHAVLVARGGNDVIRVARGDKTKHFICGGDGNDAIRGGNGSDVLIGEADDDTIYGKHGDDVMIGDNANPLGDEDGPTANDYMVGGFGGDHMVGDNYASGEVTGAAQDERLVGNNGGDTLIGDSESTGGDATGGAPDHLEGASGEDRVVGDSAAPVGTAQGGGDDEVNGGPGKDLQVGDSYTVSGMAVGGGDDALHGADGGDADATCGAGECDDNFYGDDYAASCGAQWVSCADTSGGGVDLLTTDQGDDFLNGGSPNDPELRGSGDKCAGGSGLDRATRCEYVRSDVEVVVPF